MQNHAFDIGSRGQPRSAEQSRKTHALQNEKGDQRRASTREREQDVSGVKRPEQVACRLQRDDAAEDRGCSADDPSPFTPSPATTTTRPFWIQVESNV